jgi:hypothetical protein
VYYLLIYLYVKFNKIDKLKLDIKLCIKLFKTNVSHPVSTRCYNPLVLFLPLVGNDWYSNLVYLFLLDVVPGLGIACTDIAIFGQKWSQRTSSSNV